MLPANLCCTIKPDQLGLIRAAAVGIAAPGLEFLECGFNRCSAENSRLRLRASRGVVSGAIACGTEPHHRGMQQRLRPFHFGRRPVIWQQCEVTLAVSDTPSSGVTILSFEATITGASLTSSSGSSATLISNSNPLTLELKRLEGDSTLAASVSVPAGTYNNLTISVANPHVYIFE